MVRSLGFGDEDCQFKTCLKPVTGKLFLCFYALISEGKGLQKRVGFSLSDAALVMVNYLRWTAPATRRLWDPPPFMKYPSLMAEVMHFSQFDTRVMHCSATCGEGTQLLRVLGKVRQWGQESMSILIFINSTLSSNLFYYSLLHFTQRQVSRICI